MSDELPQGWASMPLGEVTNPTRPRASPQELRHLPFVGMEQVESHTRRLLGTLPSFEMKSTAFHFQAGDVLYGRLRPYLNKVLCLNFEGLCSSEFIVLPPQPTFVPEYLALYLSTSGFVSFANQLNQGDRPRVIYPRISKST
jgi:type I restriction enzyme, S subunit